MSYVEEMPPFGEAAPLVPSPLAELQAKQAEVQAGKFQGRMLHEYNWNIFPEHQYGAGSDVVDFMRPHIAGDKVSLEGVLDGMSERADHQIHWVDMAGGRNLAQRVYNSDPARRERVTTTAVELFDYGLKGLDAQDLATVAESANGPQPRLIIADAQEVTLDHPADVITCVSGVQYLDDPLRAIANWYNQLAAGGFLFIADAGDWAHLVAYDFSATPYRLREEQSPMADMLDELTVNGVPFAATDHSDLLWNARLALNPREFRSLIVQKVPGTQMMVNTAPNIITYSYCDHKNPLYRMADPTDPTPPVQILRTPQ
jgi:SAM-dependent methyltransferase